MFGDVLFSGSRFIRWTLCPILVVTAVGFLYAIEDWSLPAVLIPAGVAATGFLFALALYDIKRFPWAARATTGMVFLVSLAYLVDVVFINPTPWRWFEPRSESSSRNAFLAFVGFGLPSLWYTLLGRFSLKSEMSGNDESREA